MPSFSLKWMLAGVAAVALGCVALLNASPVWVAVTNSATILLLLSAPILIIYREGARRAFCVGFTLFGWGYFTILSAAAVEATPGALFTYTATEYVYQLIPKQLTPAKPSSGELSVRSYVLPLVNYSPNLQDFRNVGNAVWIILLAFTGGLIARCVYATRGSAEDESG